MRVLHCVPNMAGGGAERQVGILAGAQVRAGDEVHVALVKGGPHLASLERSGAELHWIVGAGYYDPRILLQLSRLMRELAPDVVQTWLLQMDVAAGLIASWRGIPWILSERASSRFYVPTPKVRLRLRVGARAAAIVANSRAGAGYWRSRVGDRPRAFVVPNAVSVEEIAAAPAVPPPGPGGDRPLILFAGRLVPQKNLDILLEAIQGVIRRVDARAVICGEGPEAAAVARRVAALGLADRVTIAGYRDDLWGLMKSAAVFVSVSWFEGHPNTVLEAMACRCPLVVSDIAEHREFLDESMAWLVPPDRVAAIETALVEALTDRERAARQAAAAAAHVAGYTPAACAARFAEVYRTVLARNGGGR